MNEQMKEYLCHMTDAEKKAYNAEYYRNHKNYWEEYYSKGRLVGRQKNITGNGTGLFRRGEGLNSGNVGLASRPSSNRPFGREKNVTGNGTGLYRRGSGLNSGPVGKSRQQSISTRGYQMDMHGNIKPQTQQEINDGWGEDWHDYFYDQKKGARNAYQKYALVYQQKMADAKANYDQAKKDPNSEVNSKDFNEKLRKEYNKMMYKDATQTDAGMDTAVKLGYEYQKKLMKKQFKQLMASDRNTSTKVKLSMKLGKERVGMMLGMLDWKLTKGITELKMRGSNPFR